MSGKKRRSYESGHRPKFLVIADDSDEGDRAVYFAARRASRIGATMLIAAVVQPGEFQHWLGVGDVMREEAEEQARKLLEERAARARAIAGIEPELVVRTGKTGEAIVALIDEDQDISLLILAAAPGPDGPGPLVSMLAGKASGSFPVPVVIVPGSLGDAELDAMT